jgi:release factor glutamine methyltransferase
LIERLVAFVDDLEPTHPRLLVKTFTTYAVGAPSAGETQAMHPTGLERGAVVERLAAAGCVAADEEADELIAAAPDALTLEAWLARREQGEPLAWIIGVVEFCGLTIQVAPGVYVPRLQTEDLARRAAELLPVNGRALDLCTGVGAVAAFLMRAVPTATVIGVDLDEAAARCARSNSVLAVVGDLAESIGNVEPFDVITAVAPYVPTDAIRLLPSDVQRYEPRRALDGGGSGLDLVRRVIATAGRLLRPGGWLVLEVGGDQDAALAQSLDGGAFHRVMPWRDEEGDLRGIAAQTEGDRDQANR